MKVKVDKTLAASIALHVLVIGWGLVSFSTRAYVMPEEDTVAVDVISPSTLLRSSCWKIDCINGWSSSL